ncbi:Os03g0214050, partial [Oryza sativa Japonica Group]
SARSSRGQGGGGAVVDAAGEDVAVVAGDGEAVVHAAVAAPDVLEQQRRVVEGRQLGEPVVPVLDVAPPRPYAGVVRQARPAAAHHHVRRRRERAAVVARRLRHAHILNAHISHTVLS